MLSNAVPDITSHNWFLQMIPEANTEYKSMYTIFVKTALVNNKNVTQCGKKNSLELNESFLLCNCK